MPGGAVRKCCAPLLRGLGFALVLSLLLPSLASAQASSPVQAQAGGPVYTLAAVAYQIEGLLLEFALDKYLGMQSGLAFRNLAALEDYIAEKDRLLKNNRVFEEESFVAWEPAPELGKGAVRVLVYAKTGWSALAVPFPKYSDAAGFSLAVRYKDYNFLGTLETLSLAFDYFVTDTELSLLAEFGLLPEFLGSTWNLGLSGALSYKDSRGLAWPDISTSLATSYPLTFIGRDWSLVPVLSYGYEQLYDRHNVKVGATLAYSFGTLVRWSAGLSTEYALAKATGFSHGWNSRVGLSTGTALASLPYFGALSLAPSTSLYTAYNLGTALLDDAGWTSGASLGFSRVDWTGNLRKGASLSASSAYTLHFIVPAPTDLYDWATTVSTSAFYSWAGLFGINFQAVGRWEGTWTLLGEANGNFNYADRVRGLKTASFGDLGYFYNLELPVNLAQGRFLNAEKLSSEVFFVPFIDGGYIRPGPQAKFLAKADMVFCGGFELVIFPDYARAFTYRLSVGYDLGDYLTTKDFEADKLEIWLGLGLHF
jgi:hypothetical protein